MNALTLNYDPTLREQQTAGRRCRSTGTPGTEAIQRNEHLMNCYGPDIHKLSSGLASVSAVSEKLCRTRLWTRSSINQTEITQLLYTRHQTPDTGQIPTQPPVILQGRICCKNGGFVP